jgi:hypothetical protein
MTDTHEEIEATNDATKEARKRLKEAVTVDETFFSR